MCLKIRFSFGLETKDTKICLLKLAKQFELGKNAVVLAMEDLKSLHICFLYSRKWSRARRKCSVESDAL